MSLVFWWTDVLMWLLFVVIILGVRSIRGSKQSRERWFKIFQSRVAMASAVILSTYFLIALVDSVHFKINTQSDIAKMMQLPETMNDQVVSVLDMGLWHLREHQERTYSAPFALNEYSSSIVLNDEGQVEQKKLPLKFSGLELEKGQTVASDVVSRTIEMSLYLLPIFGLIIAIYLYRRMAVFVMIEAQAKEQARLPLGTFLLTFFIIVYTLAWLYYLSLSYHVLGTDKVGQDVLYASVKSIRTGVMIGLLTTLVMLPLALFLGISAGYFKGWVDDIIQYLYTTLNSIPGVLLIAAAVLVMQSILNANPDWFGTTEERADMRLLFLILILGVTSWTGLCRLLRAETLKISQMEFVTAAKAFGVGGMTTIWRHILPNLMHLVLIALVLDFSGLVLAEAVLSYVGVGVDPTMASWGNMINQARLEMAREPVVWWSLFSAFIFMFILVLAANLFSDRVQLVLDPRGNH